MSLASSAPVGLKTLALNTLADILASSPQNQDFLSGLSVMPLIPTSGHQDPSRPYDPPEKGWQRARPVSAVLALVGMAIEGEPGSETDPNERESLKLRAAAVRAFEVGKLSPQGSSSLMTEDCWAVSSPTLPATQTLKSPLFRVWQVHHRVSLPVTYAKEECMLICL